MMRFLSHWIRPVTVLLLVSLPALSQSPAASVADRIREPMRPPAVVLPSAAEQRYAAIEASAVRTKRKGPSSKLLMILGAGAAATIVGILAVKSGAPAAAATPSTPGPVNPGTGAPSISIGNISIGGPQ